jgi:hypothetical protein
VKLGNMAADGSKLPREQLSVQFDHHGHRRGGCAILLVGVNPRKLKRPFWNARIRKAVAMRMS